MPNFRSISAVALVSLAGCRWYAPPASSSSRGATCAPEPTRETGVSAVESNPPPISGGTLAVLVDRSFAISDPDRDQLVLASPDGSVVRHLEFSRGEEPGRVIEAFRGTLFVALRRGNAVVQVDAAAGKIVARYPLCDGPRGLAWNPDDPSVTVACASGVVMQLRYDAVKDLWSPAFVATVEDARDVAFVGTQLFVTSFRKGQLFEIRDGQAVEIEGPSLHADKVSGVAWRMVASHGGLVVAHQYSSLTVVDSAVPDAGVECPATSSPGYGGSPAGSRGPPPIVHGGLWHYGFGNVARLPLPDTATPVDVAVSPSGNVAMISPVGNTLTQVSSDGFVQVGATAWQPVAVGFRGEDLIEVFRDPLTLIIHNPRPNADPDAITLDARFATPTGHEVFYAQTRSRLACASCHPEGGDDGRVWNLVEGERRTPSLRGGLKGTEPFHWSGELKNMDALMTEVMGRRMGGKEQTPERIAAVLDWLDHVPALPRPALLDEGAVSRGQAIFESPAVGCAACHAGKQGTNNAVANVGTGGLFQVPRLTGLGTRAPYFHDGRIQRLEDRFLPEAGGDQHGQVSGLGEQDRADLVAYLRSL